MPTQKPYGYGSPSNDDKNIPLVEKYPRAILYLSIAWPALAVTIFLTIVACLE